MEPIPAPDIHYFRAAQGWFELDDHHSAIAELERLTPCFQEHPAVMQLRWHICAKSKEWDAAARIADALVQQTPQDTFGWIHRSNALYFGGHTREAYDQLLPALTLFPEEWPIPYNLACYICQLGDLGEAREWLRRAFNVGKAVDVRHIALADPDLAALRSWLGSL